jgi:hypothetical protein
MPVTGVSQALETLYLLHGINSSSETSTDVGLPGSASMDGVRCQFSDPYATRTQE